MSTDQQHTSKSWGHRLRQENRGLREKIAQLKKESNVLQKELKNTWKLMSNTPAALFLVQQEKIIFANETACRELEYTRKEIYAKTLPDLLHPDSISFANALQQKGRWTKSCQTKMKPFLQQNPAKSYATKSGSIKSGIRAKRPFCSIC